MSNYSKDVAALQRRRIRANGRRFRRLCGRGLLAVAAIGSLVVAGCLSGTLPSAYHTTNQSVGRVAVAWFLSTALVCLFRVFDAPLTLHKGEKQHSGAAAAILLWIFCFGTICIVLLISDLLQVMELSIALAS